MRKLFFIFLFLFAAFVAVRAQGNPDSVMILPFENKSGKAEFNWIGESFADSLSDLLKAPGLNVISNEERKTIQQQLKIPLTVVPSLATSMRVANKANVSLLVLGEYEIVPEKNQEAAQLWVRARVFDLKQGIILAPESKDKSIKPVIEIRNALASLQEIEGEVAYNVFLRRNILIYSLNDLKKIANKVPARPFEAYIKGLLASDPQLRENYFKNALRLYSEAKAEENPEEANKAVYSDAALELGHLYLNQRESQNAITYFSQIPQTDPQYNEAIFYIGLIYWQQKNYAQALEILRPLSETLKLTTVYNSLGAIAIEAARAEKKDKGRSEEFIKEGDKFLKIASENASNEIPPQFNYGLALFLSGKYQESVNQLLPLVEKNQWDGEIYFLLAKAFEKLGDTAKAADADQKAKRFLTDNNRYAKLQVDWNSGGLNGIALRIDQPPRNVFLSALTKQPAQPVVSTDDTEVLLEQAKTLYKSGNDEEAMQILLKILSRETMSGDAYFLLGSIRLRRGDLDQAVSSLKTALFWNISLIDAHIALGKIYLEKKDCAQAQNYSQSAIKLDENNEQALALQRSVERCSK